MGDDDGMMLTAYQREAVEFYRRTEDAEAQADELRALLPEAPTLAEPAPPRFNPDLAAEGARLVEAATTRRRHEWMYPDAASPRQCRYCLQSEYDIGSGSQTQEMPFCDGQQSTPPRPTRTAAVAHWLEQDARRQQQARVAVRVLEALRRATSMHQSGRGGTTFVAEFDNVEDASFVMLALGDLAP